MEKDLLAGEEREVDIQSFLVCVSPVFDLRYSSVTFTIFNKA